MKALLLRFTLILMIAFGTLINPADAKLSGPQYIPNLEAKAEVITFPGFPVRLTTATFENLFGTAELFYTAENPTDNDIWSFKANFYVIDPVGKKITKRIEACGDIETGRKNSPGCGTTGAGVWIKPHSSTEFKAGLEYRIEPESRVVAALKEMRGTGGIWRTDEESLERAVIAYATKGRIVSPEVTHEANIQLTERDKAELIRLTLILAPTGREIILSSINIRPDEVPNLLGISITLLDPGEIKERASRRGDFYYFRFDGVRPEGDRVLVFLTYTCALSGWCGSGFTYEYQKKGGKWEGRLVGGWIT